jgi:hypothetical protein
MVTKLCNLYCNILRAAYKYVLSKRVVFGMNVHFNSITVMLNVGKPCVLFVRHLKKVAGCVVMCLFIVACGNISHTKVGSLHAFKRISCVNMMQRTYRRNQVTVITFR